MELTPWQKLCHRILGRPLKKRARNDKDLSDNLVKGAMPMMPEVYLAQVIVSSITITVFCWAIIAVFFFPAIGVIDWYESTADQTSVKSCVVWEYWNADLVDETKPGNGCPDFRYNTFPMFGKILVVFIFGLVGPFVGWKIQKGKAKAEAIRRGKAIEKYLPYASSYTAAMSAANATPANIFKSLALNEDIYGEIAYDSSLIYRDITLLGYDLLTAIKMSVDRAASHWLTEFFQGMVGTLTSGGSLKLYFLNRAEHYMRENRTRLGVFLETLAMMAESYVVVAVAMPLFLIVMLVIMFWVSGSGAQMTEGMLYGIILGLIPMIHIAYSFLVWALSEDQKM